MRKVKEVLRLYHEKNLSTREIAQSLGIGRSTVHGVLSVSLRSVAWDPWVRIKDGRLGKVYS